ncbi:MAG: FumA C-terminus/TtdB family hydratase beta subunit [Deltaproteobacteria bacterium]|nr:FumA C-terminus/TtdB family hydratase beta subunit [Deltaproteobacteria bacterium]
MPARINLSTPLSPESAARLRAGDFVHLSGTVYTARDAAHKLMTEMLARGEPPPFELEGQVVYYAGPAPAPPGMVIGSVGPTTSGRMDAYSPELIRRGLRYMIGKGLRNAEVTAAIVSGGGVYFAAIGGAAALMSQRVTACEVVAFPELGTEAVRRLTVRDLPLVVAVDSRGGDYYRRPN